MLPFPSPGDLPNPGIKPRSPALQADSLLAESQGKPSAGISRAASAWQVGSGPKLCLYSVWLPFSLSSAPEKEARPKVFFSSPLCLIKENTFTWISEGKIHELSVCVVHH